MSQPRPVYLLSSPGFDARLRELVPGQEPVVLDHPEEMRGQRPGLLLLPPYHLASDRLMAALALAAETDSDAAWLPVLVESVGDELRARPVSVGWPTALAELARWAAGADDAAVLELRHVLDRVARGRHDLNNPLTSAMAETQLALMDARDPELRTGLKTIEEQLRRIRDLVAALSVLRPPL